MCKHLFAVDGHPPFRISIHRRYKRCRAGATRGAESGDSGAVGPELCKILHVDFREYFF
jgi:hypothetical protein